MKITDLGTSYLDMTPAERLEWVQGVREDRSLNKVSVNKGRKLSKELEALTPEQRKEFNRLMDNADV